MEQILYNQSFKIPTISTFQGIIFLRILILSIFQQLLYNPVIQLLETRAPKVESDLASLFRNDWSRQQHFFNVSQDSVNVTKNLFILLFTIFRLAAYLIYRLSGQNYRLWSSLDLQHLRWNRKGNTNKKRTLSFGKAYLPRTNILPISVSNVLGNRFIGLSSGKSTKCFQKAECLNNNNIKRYPVPETKAANTLLWQRQRMY
ncbi:hypothetical protein SKDZ_04G2690 [Saccharomyces kudriavzevii ZP591]|uniref:YDR042C-like protein n=1 Tax=Saccharomyces cerevisiae x Saccharomyces kudriavzevii (strain VIN7) TaxID=1095631 RepID=H0GSL2_SACCK|nr:YDR042C-like protein [Saccharomyces cerevisiae x Saccharomyces kudriavzevii VIN7]CAI4057959.1 hypothetical protein SKDZ_04G2690 [Saccharomyces kudriavzevii ZP591]